MTSGIYWCTAKYTTNRPLDGYAGSLLIIASDPGLYASQIFITDSGRYFFRTRKNGTWEAWTELVAKSDLPNYFMVTYLSKEETVEGNSWIVSSIPFSAPSWYKFFTILDVYPEGHEFVTCNRYVNGSNINVNVRNSSDKTTTRKIHANILCIKL